MSTHVRTRPHLIAAAAILSTALVLAPLSGGPADAVKPGVDVVYVADGLSYADALVGAALAAANNTSVLTVRGTQAGDSVPDATKAELTRLKPKSIVILGGPAAISDAVKSELEAYTDPPSSGAVTRLAGEDRFATAAEISQAIPEPAGVWATVETEGTWTVGATGGATGEELILSRAFTAPTDGYIVVMGQALVSNTYNNASLWLMATVDFDSNASVSSQAIGVGRFRPDSDGEADTVTLMTAAPVTAGQHQVDLHLTHAEVGVTFDYTLESLVVQFVPSGSVTVNPPSST